MKTKIEALKQKIEKLQNELKELETPVKYPIFCQSKITNSIVKFTDITTAEFIKSKLYNFGTKDNNIIPHTDTDTWEILTICEETGFYDKQPVWAWDNQYTHVKILSFYDAKNKKVFTTEGKRNACKYEHYEPYEGEWFGWMQDAFETLED